MEATVSAETRRLTWPLLQQAFPGQLRDVVPPMFPTCSWSSVGPALGGTWPGHHSSRDGPCGQAVVWRPGYYGQGWTCCSEVYLWAVTSSAEPRRRLRSVNRLEVEITLPSSFLNIGTTTLVCSSTGTVSDCQVMILGRVSHDRPLKYLVWIFTVNSTYSIPEYSELHTMRN